MAWYGCPSCVACCGDVLLSCWPRAAKAQVGKEGGVYGDQS